MSRRDDGEARRSGRRGWLEGIWIIALLALAVVAVAGDGDAKAGPKRSPDAAAADCMACHDATKVVPETHRSTKGLAWSACRDCHDKPGRSLRTRLPLNHTHLLAGVTCKDCHETLEPAGQVKSERCLTCHGTREDLVKATAGLAHNLHTSPHYGPDLECDVCHHQHRRSENFCAQCHTWDVVVPNQK